MCCRITDFCTIKGLQKRKLGMQTKETRDKKFYIGFCFGTFAVLYGLLAAFLVVRV